jgi:SAM-dependent methyltransferase
MNNVLINQLLMAIGKEDLIKNYINNWRKVSFDPKRSLQENVGFSHQIEVDKAISKIHSYIKAFDESYLDENAVILDIGCGVGLYLSDFRTKNCHGTDLNSSFLDKCKVNYPHVNTREGNYLDLGYENESFDLIISISVIEYIPPNRIRSFFEKIYRELKPNAYLIVQYPHALTWGDRFYSDLSYVSYTPEVIERKLGEKFRVLLHEHSFDKRKVKGIDKIRYGIGGKRSFCDGMILIAQKI